MTDVVLRVATPNDAEFVMHLIDLTTRAQIVTTGPLRLRVLKSNPSRVLYERLAFHVTEATPERYFMEFRA